MDQVIANRWDDTYRRGIWSTNIVEFNRLRLVAGWIETFGAARVLDVGCGRGRLLRFLPSGRVTAYCGIDASRLALDEIEPRPGIEISSYCLDVQSESPPQGLEFDCVCFIDVLQFCDDPAAVVRRYAQNLKPGGFVVTCHFVRPERIQSPPVAGAELYTETDEKLEEAAIDVLLDSVVLLSRAPTSSARWHLKVFTPKRETPAIKSPGNVGLPVPVSPLQVTRDAQPERSLDDEMRQFIATHPVATLEQNLRSLLAPHGEQFIHPVPGYAAVLANALSELIRARQPASVIRLGDGEGNVLGALDDRFPRLATDSMQRLTKLMFGRNPRDETEVADLKAGMVAAVNNADIIGVPDWHRLQAVARQIAAGIERGKLDNTRGNSGVANTLIHTHALLRAAGGRPAPIVTNAYCHRDLLPFYHDLLQNEERVGLISCFAELPERLKSYLSINHVDFYQIPGQASNLQRLGAAWPDQYHHYPNRFGELMGSLAVAYRGQVFLVAAGILGKIYCTRLKSLGAIALDVGSIADVWMGKAVRDYHADDFIRQWQLAPAARLFEVSQAQVGANALSAGG